MHEDLKMITTDCITVKKSLARSTWHVMFKGTVLGSYDTKRQAQSIRQSLTDQYANVNVSVNTEVEHGTD